MAHELALNSPIQEKLYEEIKNVQTQLAGKPLTYETIQKMKYLDMVMSETLRKWPVAGIIDRVANKEITLKNIATDLHVKPGDSFWIPAYAIHRDPKYYPNPEQFDPDRFSENNIGQIHAGIYMPFGIGPRACIGSRFALMECKAIYYHLLLKFRLEKCTKTQNPLRLGKGFSAIAEKGFWVKLISR